MEEENKNKYSLYWGVGSLVSSIVGLLIFLAPYFGLPLSIVALIFSYQSRKLKANGYAIAGLVIGIIGIIINAMSGLFLGLYLLAIGGL